MPCCPHPDGWVAQAQVWLGTLVEVALPAAESSDTCFAVAFAAIAHVHRVMSAHDASSDLARIAREAHRATVTVDAGTYAVLQLAQQLFRESGGTLDVAIAPLLARHGLLPPGAAGNTHDSGAPCGGMDALTKIVALQPAESATLLARHGAHGFTIGGEGPRSGPQPAATCATTCTATTANLRLPLAAVA